MMLIAVQTLRRGRQEIMNDWMREVKPTAKMRIPRLSEPDHYCVQMV